MTSGHLTSPLPTEKQYATLLMLGGGSAWLSVGKRKYEPLAKRGWVEGEWRDPYWQFVRITADGLRALAAAVEKYGLPVLGSPVKYHVTVCAECGADWRPKCRCGSGQHRFVEREMAA